MSESVTLILLAAMAGAMASWLLPRALAADAMAVFTLAVLAALSPETACWLVAAALLARACFWAGDRFGGKGWLLAGLVVALVASLVLAEFSDGYLWIGLSFAALRLVHVAADWWMGRMAAPDLRDLARYLFFLPVVTVGPVHRLPNFQRQIERRRFDWADLLTGLERCLVGLFMAHVLGEVLVGRLDGDLLARKGVPPGFLRDWLVSAIDWVKLYLVFAGLSHVALGTSLMMGLRLEENFNQPWRAANLLDFWSRWHMSLTQWSRDYAFRPVMALTRSPVVGLLAAMLVIGLWHEFSVYYLLWSFWQAMGVMLSRALGRVMPLGGLPVVPGRVLVFAGILGWLSLARPAITLLLGTANDTALALF